MLVISRKGQAYSLSRDHKPYLEAEKERILKAGGFIHAGRVNGCLNLARAIANPDINTSSIIGRCHSFISFMKSIFAFGSFIHSYKSTTHPCLRFKIISRHALSLHSLHAHSHWSRCRSVFNSMSTWLRGTRAFRPGRGSLRK
ncbi:hypothetical protein OIU77_002465 [Salix suchowensis]|uniref:PPM-type phosphatase domain-containing protein n=1 Tax=Salix suchowensis TaxID=1278906 RepID=A0ABQ9AWF8_9ROSI|nr:hypothetical protein OIU77_002465 [Salix suchowensis]